MPVPQGLPYVAEAFVGGGLYADVYRAKGPKGTVALKVARAKSRLEDLQQTVAWGTEILRFDTGSTATSVVSLEEINELVAVEAEQLLQLRHPAFVQLMECGTACVAGQERRYLATEWIHGRTWRQMLDTGETIPLRAVYQVVMALVEAGQQHGDLKPDNLFLDDQQNVRIIDPSAGATRFDDAGVLDRLLLTDWYNPLLVASDIPAIGILAMEVTTGAQPLLVATKTSAQHPIGERLDRWLRCATAIGRGRKLGLIPRLPFPRDLNPNVGEPLEAVMLRCLQLQRQGWALEITEPYANLGELAAALAIVV
jgi:serine/threonine protein kinase